MVNKPHLPQRASIRLPGYDYTQPGAYFITLCTQWREALFGEIVNGEMRLSAAGRVAAAEWRRLGRQFPGIRVGAFVVMPNHVHGILVIEDVGATRRGPINTLVDEGGSPVPRQDAARMGEGGSPGEIQTNQSLRATVDRPTRATLDNENETISGENMEQNDIRPDQYGSPLHDAYPVGATRRGPINTLVDEGGSPVPGQDAGVEATRRGQINTPGDEAGSPVGDRPNGPAEGSLGAVIGQFKSRATRRIRSIPGYEQIPVWQRNYYEHIIRNEAEWGMIAEYIKNNPGRWEQDRLHPDAPEQPMKQEKPHGE